MKRLLGNWFVVPLVVFCAVFVPLETRAQTGDYGDAPEGVLAYPATGGIGQFPTCRQLGPAGFIYHGFIAQNAWFGPMVDFEPDGNAGVCPPPPWDNDECSQLTDNDAGLIVPDPYTIVGGLVTTCGQPLNPRALGMTCATAVWGVNVDIRVTNNSTAIVYVNVLMDWDQSGAWSGSSICPAGNAPERVLTNLPVPASYSGPLSALGPPAFLIGPKPGYVWTRFTVSPNQLGGSWPGVGNFTFGESEDYLLRVDEGIEYGDFGDAPEYAMAYPSLGIQGQFPTCVNILPAGFVAHRPGSMLWFGPTLDFEIDGNAGTCPQPPYDQDECSPGTDNDAGLVNPDPYTIVGGVETLCTQVPTPRALGTTCTQANWGANVDIIVYNNSSLDAYVNVLMDWDQSGTWGGSAQCPMVLAPEWVLQNYLVPGGFNGPLSALGPPPGFLIGPRTGYVWSRFTITPVPIASTDWDGSGLFDAGESEDYLLRVDESIDYGDFGDAPEYAIAYPTLGIQGQFPTCVNILPAGFVFHRPGTTFWFGVSLDFEIDGNAGTCPQPPYDQDECSPNTDNDAGLVTPDPYTIVGGAETLCSQVSTPRALGTICTQAFWGPNVDIQVVNNSSMDVYVNVLMDWDQSGTWGGSSQCPLALAPEWVLQNFQVLAGFSGPLSALLPPGFLVGPQAGYIWSRFSITPVPILSADWDGSGIFDAGESEDYLLRVDLPMHEGDLGDAPEGAVAYPGPGTIGQFPTCISIGPTGYVYHSMPANVFLGPTVDSELDGNAGVCPQPPYDQDECSPATDVDAGLILPDAYTIVGGVVTTCGQVPAPRSLGTVCTTANWGANVDVIVNNSSTMDVYVNVLMDWDQSGTWGGASQCPGGLAPEWVLANFPVWPGYVGPLSGLLPPGFLIGAVPGYVWSRITISPQQVVATDWDGSGSFTDGESEDYLLRVDEAIHEGDFGDAPEGAVAYPVGPGILGQFPTCINIGPLNSYVSHVFPTLTWFGQMVDAELDGNAGICPQPPYDQDECSQGTDPDAGLLIPDPYTIVGGVPTPCSPISNPRPLGGNCAQAIWGQNIDIWVNNNSPAEVFVNVLMDWDQNGTWGGASVCPQGVTPEWVLINLLVPPGYSGPLSPLGPPPFRIGPQGGFVWSRFTISSQALLLINWDGSGSFVDGESEDYMLYIDPAASGVNETEGSGVRNLVLETAQPNPSNPTTTIAWEMPVAAMVRVTVYDCTGRVLRQLVNQPLSAGRHTTVWDGVDDAGQPIGSGLYVVKVVAGIEARATKVLLVR